MVRLVVMVGLGCRFWQPDSCRQRRRADEGLLKRTAQVLDLGDVCSCRFPMGNACSDGCFAMLGGGNSKQIAELRACKEASWLNPEREREIERERERFGLEVP